MESVTPSLTIEPMETFSRQDSLVSPTKDTPTNLSQTRNLNFHNLISRIFKVTYAVSYGWGSGCGYVNICISFSLLKYKKIQNCYLI